ncbi:MAG: pyridine nucleotide-disulfide oxidoreductase, partial [Gammaproteobacteria bacterium]
MRLGIEGFTYSDLYAPSRLGALLEVFNTEYAGAAPAAYARFAAYRDCLGEGMSAEAISEVLVESAPMVGHFIARLFGIEAEHGRDKARITAEFNTIFRYRAEVVERLPKRFKSVAMADWDRALLKAQARCLCEIAREPTAPYGDDEFLTAKAGVRLLDLAAGLTASDPQAIAEVSVLRQAIATHAREDFRTILEATDDIALV